jgi:hypothetical protein
MSTLSRSHLLSLGIPALALLAALGSASTGCSSTVAAPAGTTDSTLPCCHDGFIYRCANQAALSACGDSTKDDTTDCTKTSSTCGGAAGPQNDAGPKPDSSVAKKATGDKCELPADCTGDLCLVFGTGTVGFCSKVCANASDCPNRFNCNLAEKLGSKVCVPMGDKRVGDPCTNPTECASEVCLTRDGAGYCSAPCGVPAECPAGWACGPVNGSAGKYCLK